MAGTLLTNPAVWRLRVTVGLVLAMGTVSSCVQHEEEGLDQVARAVAMELDSLNGLPTAVMDEYRCEYGVERCRERPGYESASFLDATVLASAFADARGIPIVRYGEVEPPVCPWFGPARGRGGLWAEFTRPPVIEGDSATVSLATWCLEGAGGFEQVHEFILRNEGGEWRVVLRQLNSIT